MRGLLTLLAILAISSCASVPIESTPDWQFDGKVSLQSGGETRVASISWWQRAGVSDIRLSGPVGMGAVLVRVEGDSMQITSGEGTRTIGLDEPVLVDGRTLVLPWAAMAQWVRGVTEAGETIPEKGLTTGGWQIDILRRGDLGPRLMTFRHPAVNLRLSVSKWLISGA